MRYESRVMVAYSKRLPCDSQRSLPYIQGMINNVVGADQSSIQSLIVTLDASRTVFEILTFKLENGLFLHSPVFDAPARYAAAHYSVSQKKIPPRVF